MKLNKSKTNLYLSLMLASLSLTSCQFENPKNYNVLETKQEVDFGKTFKTDYGPYTVSVNSWLNSEGAPTNYSLTFKKDGTVEVINVYKENPFVKEVKNDSEVVVFEPNGINNLPNKYETSFDLAPFKNITKKDLDSIVGLADKYFKKN